MAAETLYASAFVSGTLSTPGNAVGAQDNVYTTDVDNVSWTALFDMGNPVGNTANGDHTFTLRVRKETGSGTPVLNAISLYQGGVLVVEHVIDRAVTVTGLQIVSEIFTEAEMRQVTDLSQLQIHLRTTGAGGSGSARTTVQLDSITWTGDFTTGTPPPPADTSAFFAFM